MKLGLIAGNGKFPFLVLEGAKRAGTPVAVAAIREETDPSIEKIADRLTWVGIGQLGKMLRFFKDEGVDKAIMAGQVKHVQIFSAAIPDLRMLKMLLRLPRRNTDALIGAVANELASEGIELIDSTYFLKDQLPEAGALTRRTPDDREKSDLEYGLEIAKEIAPAWPSRPWKARTPSFAARANWCVDGSLWSRLPNPIRTCALMFPSSV